MQQHMPLLTGGDFDGTIRPSIFERNHLIICRDRLVVQSGTTALNQAPPLTIRRDEPGQVQRHKSRNPGFQLIPRCLSGRKVGFLATELKRLARRLRSSIRRRLTMGHRSCFSGEDLFGLV